jgi:hypothetical protein
MIAVTVAGAVGATATVASSVMVPESKLSELPED